MQDAEYPKREEVVVVLDPVHLEHRQAGGEDVPLLAGVEQESVLAATAELTERNAELVHREHILRHEHVIVIIIVVEDERGHDLRDEPVEVVEHRIIRPVRGEDSRKRAIELRRHPSLVEAGLELDRTQLPRVHVRLPQARRQAFIIPVVPHPEEILRHLREDARRLSRPAAPRLVHRLNERIEERQAGGLLVPVLVLLPPRPPAPERIEGKRAVGVIRVVNAVLPMRLLANH